MRSRRLRFQRDHMLLVQSQLGGILNGDDALLEGNEAAEHVEHGRFAGAGPTAYQYVSIVDHTCP